MIVQSLVYKMSMDINMDFNIEIETSLWNIELKITFSFSDL